MSRRGDRDGRRGPRHWAAVAASWQPFNAFASSWFSRPQSTLASPLGVTETPFGRATEAVQARQDATSCSDAGSAGEVSPLEDAPATQAPLPATGCGFVVLPASLPCSDDEIETSPDTGCRRFRYLLSIGAVAAVEGCYMGRARAKRRTRRPRPKRANPEEDAASRSPRRSAAASLEQHDAATADADFFPALSLLSTADCEARIEEELELRCSRALDSSVGMAALGEFEVTGRQSGPAATPICRQDDFEQGCRTWRGLALDKTGEYALSRRKTVFQVTDLHFDQLMAES